MFIVLQGFRRIIYVSRSLFMFIVIHFEVLVIPYAYQIFSCFIRKIFLTFQNFWIEYPYFAHFTSLALLSLLVLSATAIRPIKRKQLIKIDLLSFAILKTCFGFLNFV